MKIELGKTYNIILQGRVLGEWTAAIKNKNGHYQGYIDSHGWISDDEFQENGVGLVGGVLREKV